MERDPPLGVGPGFLNQAQMYSQGQNTAVITSYLQLLQQSLRALDLIVLACRALELRLEEIGGTAAGTKKPTWLDQASECRGNAETGNSCGWSGCWPCP